MALAQTPDVMVRLDVRPTLRTQLGGANALRWYDVMGHHSTVGVYLILEPGLRALVSERLQRIPNDGDSSQIDEYWIEDEGLWRVGKQYIPFGRGMIVRESVEGARADSNLLFEGFLVSGAVFDAGKNRQRGAVVRLQGPIGLSVAVGRNLGISGSTLAVVRDPEKAAGARGGYRSIVGMDFVKRSGIWRFQAEVAAFTGGERKADREREVSDLLITAEPNPNRLYGVGWSRAWDEKNDTFRIQAQIPLQKSVWAEPIVRYRGGVLRDFAFTLRVKL